MLETTNYALPLYEANDAPNLLDGYNNAMQTIDTQLQNTATSAANASTAAANKAPINHAATSGTYGIGTAANFGHVQLSDSTNSTSQASAGIAATPYAVRAAYQAAQDKAPQSHASTNTTYGVGNATNYGHVKLMDYAQQYGATAGTALTPKALSDYLIFNELPAVSAGQSVACPNGWMSGRVSNNHQFFKVYGNPTFITSAEISAFKSACVSVPGLSGVTGVAIFSGLGSVDNAYEIGTGGFVLTGESATAMTFYGIGQTVLAVGTDGRVYLEYNSQMDGKSFAAMNMPACLYVNTSFEDQSNRG